MRRGDKRAASTVIRLKDRFGDVTLSEALDLLKCKRDRKRGRPDKWDDDIAGDVYLWVLAIMRRRFGKTASQKKLAQYKNLDLSFSEIVTGFNRGEACLGKLSPSEIQESIEDMLEWMPGLNDYIKGLNPPAKTAK